MLFYWIYPVCRTSGRYLFIKSCITKESYAPFYKQITAIGCCTYSNRAYVYILKRRICTYTQLRKCVYCVRIHNMHTFTVKTNISLIPKITKKLNCFFKISLPGNRKRTDISNKITFITGGYKRIREGYFINTP